MSTANKLQIALKQVEQLRAELEAEQAIAYIEGLIELIVLEGHFNVALGIARQFFIPRAKLSMSKAFQDFAKRVRWWVLDGNMQDY